MISLNDPRLLRTTPAGRMGNDQQFTKLCTVLDCPELARDEKFATNRARVQNRKELLPILRRVTVQCPTSEWLERLEAAGVPCGPVNTLDQVFSDPQVLAREMKVSITHPKLGAVPSVGNPLKFQKTPVSYRHAPPLLGE